MRALYAMLFDRMPSTWALEKVGHQTHSSHRRCIHVWACPLERSSLEVPIGWWEQNFGGHRAKARGPPKSWRHTESNGGCCRLNACIGAKLCCLQATSARGVVA